MKENASKSKKQNDGKHNGRKWKGNVFNVLIKTLTEKEINVRNSH